MPPDHAGPFHDHVAEQDTTDTDDRAWGNIRPARDKCCRYAHSLEKLTDLQTPVKVSVSKTVDHGIPPCLEIDSRDRHDPETTRRQIRIEAGVINKHSLDRYIEFPELIENKFSNRIPAKKVVHSWLGL